MPTKLPVLRVRSFLGRLVVNLSGAQRTKGPQIRLVAGGFLATARDARAAWIERETNVDVGEDPVNPKGGGCSLVDGATDK